MPSVFDELVLLVDYSTLALVGTIPKYINELFDLLCDDAIAQSSHCGIDDASQRLGVHVSILLYEHCLDSLSDFVAGLMRAHLIRDGVFVPRRIDIDPDIAEIEGQIWILLVWRIFPEMRHLESGRCTTFEGLFEDSQKGRIGRQLFAEVPQKELVDSQSTDAP